MTTAVAGLTALLYLVSGGWLGWRLTHASQAGLRGGRAWPLAIGGVAGLLHAGLLWHTILLPAGLNLGFFHAVSLSGWLVAVLLLLLSVLRPVENLGIVLLPFAAGSVLAAAAFPAPRILADSAAWGLELHILLSVLAWALLALAAVQACLVWLQNRQLRLRRPGGFVLAMPPLLSMESMLFQMLGLGFVMLALALLSGALFINNFFAQHLLHKTVLSVLAWLLFGGLLWGRWRYGWRGRRAISLTLGGFAVLALAYFGSKLVIELILQR